MGKDHNYLDDLQNRAIMQKVARQCYLPDERLAAQTHQGEQGKFRCSFSITGIAIEQMKAFRTRSPRLVQGAAATGCVEFSLKPTASLAALASGGFEEQVSAHTNLIKKEFGVKPTAFRNTELIYSGRNRSHGGRNGIPYDARRRRQARPGLEIAQLRHYANAIDQKFASCCATHALGRYRIPILRTAVGTSGR